ncbi:MAG: ATP-binding protein, partial [Actinomycetota bacterium]|nr:ATP-binding protein [Actinomycetota bacterium]
MTEEEFNASFPHETAVIERKTGAGSKGIGDAVVAFSNAEGGLILIGVDDGGTIVGRELTPGLEDDLHRIMRNVSGAGRYELHPLAVDGKQVTVVSVSLILNFFAQTSV